MGGWMDVRVGGWVGRWTGGSVDTWEGGSHYSVLFKLHKDPEEMETFVSLQ